MIGLQQQGLKAEMLDPLGLVRFKSMHLAQQVKGLQVLTGELLAPADMGLLRPWVSVSGI